MVQTMQMEHPAEGISKILTNNVSYSVNTMKAFKNF